MKKLKVDAVVLDLRHLTEETLAAYDKCEMEAVFALMNPHAQALLNQYGVKLDVVQSINGEDDVDVSTINGKATLDGSTPILDVVPERLHQRIPVALGSAHEVDQIAAA